MFSLTYNFKFILIYILFCLQSYTEITSLKIVDI